ncbi:MAG: hypothetical protein JSV04_01735 [Candidatus Heimdallarchaeota archaeon]|nr:MAG: hypothetical protein JSV04_01735 [Candidatus Heimdallarchaeota archaeon]
MIFFSNVNLNGTRVVVAAFGILCGLTGIIAGIFEINQGNNAPSGFVISTIGPKYSMADDFTYFAVTLVPNFLITGFLAIIISSLVIIWSVRFVHRKNGVIILLALSVTQMLVGGGWVIDLALITCVLATRINKPLNWWRTHLSPNVQLWLVKLFPFSLIVYAIISFIMLVLTIFGVNDLALIKPLEVLATAMFIPILLMIFGGLAQDIQSRLTTKQNKEAM